MKTPFSQATQLLSPRLPQGLLVSLLIGTSALQGQDIEQGFATPPDHAKPYTWWHWVDGNVSKEGITKDLEAMKAVGLGGYQLFDAGLRMPTGPIVFGSEKYFEMLSFALSESERLGLDAGFNNCSGWSSSGGPWVTVENSMKTIVWSKTTLSGGQETEVTLAQPLIRKEQLARKDVEPHEFYRDLTVLAFPTPKKPAYRLKDWMPKSLTAQDAKPDLFKADQRKAPLLATIATQSILDISEHMDASGTLNWEAPNGDWTVIRFGYTTTRATNKPGSRGAIGFEIDKLSREAADVHWTALIEKMIASGQDGKALTTVLIDSYEVGMQNWTENFPTEFKKRRGYDLMPMLVAVTGRILDNTETSERILWDLRTTVAELMEENYYGYFAERCHQHGLQLATEPYGSGTFDGPAIARLSDIPMTEFWQKPQRNLWQWTSQIAPSGAHLTGRKVVGAESFTSMEGDWKAHPASLKKFGDRAFADGINRYYFHTFAHQPWNDAVKPGMTMGRFGGNFHRNNTWFSKSQSWMEYLARCQFIMQSGTYQADVLALYGDETGFNSFLNRAERPDMQPIAGHNFDLGGMKSLPDLSVDKEGRIRVTYEGKLLETRYQVLLLKRANLMLPAHIAKLGELAEQGATIFAPRPLRSPSLSQHPEADNTLADLIKRYWDTGLIQEPKAFNDAVAKLAPDCEVPADILFNHHLIGDSSYYFLANPDGEATTFAATFRSSGKQPELWNPLTGKITEAGNWKALENGRTEVEIKLEAVDSLFVVFRHETDSKGETTPEPLVETLTSLTGPWNVQFDPAWGPKEPVVFETLTAWNEHDDDAVRHFSGSATYEKEFHLEKIAGTMILDLGQVDIMARVTLNGQDLGTLWKPPYELDITEAVHQSGNNVLEIEVTNLWVNRLIGEERFPKSKGQPSWIKAGLLPPADAKRQAYTPVTKYHKKGDALSPSGLLGPVKVVAK